MYLGDFYISYILCISHFIYFNILYIFIFYILNCFIVLISYIVLTVWISWHFETGQWCDVDLRIGTHVLRTTKGNSRFRYMELVRAIANVAFVAWGCAQRCTVTRTSCRADHLSLSYKRRRHGGKEQQVDECSHGLWEAVQEKPQYGTHRDGKSNTNIFSFIYIYIYKRDIYIYI